MMFRMLRKMVELTLLTVAFVLGVGAIGLVRRLFGARFLNNKPTLSTWQTPTGSRSLERMY